MTVDAYEARILILRHEALIILSRQEAAIIQWKHEVFTILAVERLSAS